MFKFALDVKLYALMESMDEKGILEWLFDDDIEPVQSIPLRPVGPAVSMHYTTPVPRNITA